MDTLMIDNLSGSFNKKEFIDNIITPENNINLELHYSSRFENAKILRDFIEVIFYKINVWSKYLSRFILATDEMNNNAIEYGSMSWEKNTLRIKISNSGEKIKIIIEVEDTWKGKNHKTAKQMEDFKEEKIKNGLYDNHSIRGRGLFIIIVNIVDVLYFKDSQQGGLIVGIEKEIHKI